MKISAIVTINNRPPAVSSAVALSFCSPGNHPDEMIVVLDRPTKEAEVGAREAYKKLSCPVRFIKIDGPQGWLCPAKAWNTGFDSASGDLLFLSSSDVIQDANNIQIAKSICKNGDTVAFGACHNSVPTNLVVGAEPGLLASSKMPRPLGFMACVPTGKIREIGGCDLGFMGGLWYEDDDLYLRLWRTGLNFIFSDDIHGVHLDHPRPDLDTVRGQQMIRRNADYMTKKHGGVHRWNDLLKREVRSGGTLTWEHI